MSNSRSPAAARLSISGRIDCIVGADFFKAPKLDATAPRDLLIAMGQHAHAWWDSLDDDQRYAIFVANRETQ